MKETFGHHGHPDKDGLKEHRENVFKRLANGQEKFDANWYFDPNCIGYGLEYVDEENES